MRYPLVQRGLIALVLVLAMAVWFSASAVVPALATQWHLSAGSAAWMTAPVQAGFVLGAVGSAVLAPEAGAATADGVESPLTTASASGSTPTSSGPVGHRS